MAFHFSGDQKRFILSNAISRFPAELHMVHVKEDYVMEDGTVDSSAAFAAADGLAVLGIFIREGTDDATWFDVSLSHIFLSIDTAFPFI